MKSLGLKNTGLNLELIFKKVMERREKQIFSHSGDRFSTLEDELNTRRVKTAKEVMSEFRVSENLELGYSLVEKEENGESGFELLVSEEILPKIRKIGWKKVRGWFEEDIQAINEDFKNTKSVDAQNKTSRRKVSLLSKRLEQVFGLPAVVKQNGKESNENLVEQFVYARALQKKWALLPKNLKQVLEICPVYMAVKIKVEAGNKYFLVMKKVQNAKQINDYPINLRQELTFNAQEHPTLAELFGIKKGLIRWSSVGYFFEERFGIKLVDLAGRNVLYDSKTPKTQRSYTIIDQEPPHPTFII
jgi:hypothetical protein